MDQTLPPPASPAQPTEARPLAAFAWMMAAVASFTLMAASGRLIRAELDTFELMFYRSLLGFVLVCAILALRGALGSIRPSRPALHAGRNTIHFLGQCLWFHAIAFVPLAQVTALEFTNPIWVAVLAPFLLGERFTAARLGAAVLGFAGVVIAAQPGSVGFGSGQAAVLVAALCYALTTILTRRIMAFDGVLCVLFWMTLTQMVLALVLALPGGLPWPSAGLWPFVVVVALTGLAAHFCLTSALGHAPAVVVAPMDYARLPAMAATGALVFGEPLETAVLAGAALIIAGNVIGLRAETRTRSTAADKTLLP